MGRSQLTAKTIPSLLSLVSLILVCLMPIESTQAAALKSTNANLPEQSVSSDEHLNSLQSSTPATPVQANNASIAPPKNYNAGQIAVRAELQKQMNELLISNAQINQQRIRLLEDDKRKIFWAKCLVAFLVSIIVIALFSFWRIHTDRVFQNSLAAISSTLGRYQDSFLSFIDTAQLATETNFSNFHQHDTSGRNTIDSNTKDALREDQSQLREDSKGTSTHINLPTAPNKSKVPDALHTPDEFFAVKNFVDSWLRVYKPIETSDKQNIKSKSEKKKKASALLALLESYRASDDDVNYELTYKEIKKLFNLNLKPWEMPGRVEQKQLSAFPHVVNKILELWHTDEVEIYLERLLHNSRIQPREGFDPDLYQNLERLYELVLDPQRPRQLSALKGNAVAAFLFIPTESISPIQKTRVVDRVAETMQKKNQIVDNKNSPTPITNSHVAPVVSEKSTTAVRQPAQSATESSIPTPILPIRQTKASSNDSPSIDEKFLLSPFEVRLKLAVAYVEMGDSEGACLLLEEVIHDAPPDQKRHAQHLLKSIQEKRLKFDLPN